MSHFFLLLMSHTCVVYTKWLNCSKAIMRLMHSSHSSPSARLLTQPYFTTQKAGCTLMLPREVCCVVISCMSKAKFHFWHGLPCQNLISLDHAMTKWLTDFQWPLQRKQLPREVDVSVGSHLRDTGTNTYAIQMLLLPSLHAWLMHACHTHDRGTKQTRKQKGLMGGRLL